MNTFKAITWTILLAICGLLAGGCEKQKPVQLGFVGTLTGRGADLGVAGRNGTILAVEKRNSAGGIKGRPVELLIRDDEQNPEVARKMTSELLGLQVAAIVGPMTSSMAMATVPLLRGTSTIMVSPTATTTELSGREDNFFRVISSTAEYAAKNARFQFEALGHRTAVVLYDLNNRSYTESWFDNFRYTFEGLGGRILGAKTFQSGQGAVFKDAVEILLAFKPDLVVIISNAVDSALICQQVRKFDQQVGINLSEWAATERVIELGGAAVEGAFTDQFFNRGDHSDRFASFLRAYRERFSLDPGFAGVAAYDAATVVLDALAGQRPGQSLREVILANPSFHGLQAPITFDRFGDAHRKTYMSTIRHGKFEIVE